ncbi:hypothetical protein FGLOB1_11330 [Fusarium globosum]|uniref:Uncharacterized protein n=1 Tax=Fusarium globosum TaxID=78864 RepID=A0A8H5XTA3_9HYPO|nr:hypothetical protein FGLOB1_11330 [Fusarium globosum]
MLKLFTPELPVGGQDCYYRGDLPYFALSGGGHIRTDEDGDIDEWRTQEQIAKINNLSPSQESHRSTQFSKAHQIHAFDLHLEDDIDMLDFELPEQYTYDYLESHERQLLDELNTIDGRRMSLSGLKKFQRDKVTPEWFSFLLCPRGRHG